MNITRYVCLLAALLLLSHCKLDFDVDLILRLWPPCN